MKPRCSQKIFSAIFLAIFAFGMPSVALGEAAGVVVEWSTLSASPESDSARMKVYLKNQTDRPLTVLGTRLNRDRYMDMILFEEAIGGLPSGLLDFGETHRDSNPIPSHEAGDLQWHRVFPNPIGPGEAGELSISLWGAMNHAELEIKTSDGESLNVLLDQADPRLRLSQIIFDPVDPNKVYVYLENECNEEVRVEQVEINSERAEVVQNIPNSPVITPHEKACFIVRPSQQIKWGDYVSVGLVGNNGREAMCLVRVINLFPIGEWDTDLRPEMCFDTVDIKGGPGIPVEAGGEGDRSNTRQDISAYCPRRDINRDGEWKENVQFLVGEMNRLHNDEETAAIYTNLREPIVPTSAGYFGDIPDFLFLNTYRSRNWGPSGPSAAVRVARMWTDPKPVMSIPETFVLYDRYYWQRYLSPLEIRYAVLDQIAEGVKGIRYYRAHGMKNEKGYEDVLNMKRIVEQLNLDIQLLKPFLRLGDRWNSRCLPTVEDLACKTILCGERGLVIVLLNQAYQQRLKGIPAWRPIIPGRISFAIPEGFESGRLFKVDQGFIPAEFEASDGYVHFDAGKVRETSVYLFWNLEGDLIETDPQAGKNPFRDLKVAAEVVAAYRQARTLLLRDMLNPASITGERDGIETGLNVSRLRAAALKRLAELEQSISSGAADRVKVLCGLAEAHVDMGEAEAVLGLSQRHAAELMGESYGDFVRHLSSLCSESGEYLDAVAILEEALKRAGNSETRCRLLHRLLDIYKNSLRDFEKAIEFGRRIRKELPLLNDPILVVRFDLEFSALLIAAGKSDEAILTLNSLNRNQLPDKHLDYLYGMAHESRKDFAAAISSYTKAAKGSGDEAAQAQFRIGMIHLERKEYAAAREAFSVFKETYPGNPYFRRAEDFLRTLETLR